MRSTIKNNIRILLIILLIYNCSSTNQKLNDNFQQKEKDKENYLTLQLDLNNDKKYDKIITQRRLSGDSLFVLLSTEQSTYNLIYKGTNKSIDGINTLRDIKKNKNNSNSFIIQLGFPDKQTNIDYVYVSYKDNSLIVDSIVRQLYSNSLEYSKTKIYYNQCTYIVNKELIKVSPDILESSLEKTKCYDKKLD